VRALGVDVSVRRGLDVVLLDGSAEPAVVRRGVEPEALPTLLRECQPDVVAIDSPPTWGVSGGSRLAERELRRRGIQSYGTPSDANKGEHTFYGWMKVGFRAFGAAAEGGYDRYRRGSVAGHAVEVFPHATAVVLAGCLPPPAVPKHTWRASVLRAQGLSVPRFRSADQIDAALAALTGLFALSGEFAALGDPEEGVIVVPSRHLPETVYRRCAHPSPPEPQLRLPGLSPCGCGEAECREMTSREFAPGHDAKRKSLLWEKVRAGEDARTELRRRRWDLPPELR
jgi:predicted RNase H-like nuclease